MGRLAKIYEDYIEEQKALTLIYKAIQPSPKIQVFLAEAANALAIQTKAHMSIIAHTDILLGLGNKKSSLGLELAKEQDPDRKIAIEVKIAKIDVEIAASQAILNTQHEIIDNANKVLSWRERPRLFLKNLAKHNIPAEEFYLFISSISKAKEQEENAPAQMAIANIHREKLTKEDTEDKAKIIDVVREFTLTNLRLREQVNPEHVDLMYRFFNKAREDCLEYLGPDFKQEADLGIHGLLTLVKNQYEYREMLPPYILTFISEDKIMRGDSHERIKDQLEEIKRHLAIIDPKDEEHVHQLGTLFMKVGVTLEDRVLREICVHAANTDNNLEVRPRRG
jgi:hypothetical protein